MRELVFSVGITFLTGTLLFVYFRNKISNIDRKVNMVFETIQEHNNRMQVEAQEEMKRFQMFHEQQMQMAQQHHQEEQNEPMEQIRTEPNELIDVSEQESELSDMSDDESSDDDNSDDDNNENDEEVKVKPEVVTLSDDGEKPSDNGLTDLLNNGLTEVNVENISPLGSNLELNEEEEEDVSNGLEIMEEKLNSKSSDTLVNYNKYTKAQLRNICEERGLTGWKSLNKTKLVSFLENQ